MSSCISTLCQLAKYEVGRKIIYSAYILGSLSSAVATIHIYLQCSSTGCPTRYRTWHFLKNSNTNEDIATKFEQENVLFFHIFTQ